MICSLSCVRCKISSVLIYNYAIGSASHHWCNHFYEVLQSFVIGVVDWVTPYNINPDFSSICYKYVEQDIE